MRKFLFFLFGMSCFQGWGQVVLETPIPPPTGYGSDLFAGAFIAPTAPSDAEQTWDFSDVAGTILGAFELMPASNSPLAPAFDGADWYSRSGDQMSFWNLEDDGLNVLGNANAANFVTVPFVDPLTIWNYPMQYGNAAEDTFAADFMLFGSPYTLMGNGAIEFDAWGNLTLPGADAPSAVLRAHYTQVYTETYAGDTVTTSLEQYMYFAEGAVWPVFYHELLMMTDPAGTVLLDVTDVAWYGPVTVGVREEHADTVGSPFPNPATAGERVTWSLPNGWTWEAMDGSGRRVASGAADGSGQLVLETADWGSGLVILVPLMPDGRPGGQVHKVILR